MTHLLPTEAPRRLGGNGFLRRTWGMLVKEFIQLRRDRVSFAMIIMIPLVQLILFGYAINTNPRNLPTAVLLQEQSDLGRSILAALENTKYFKITELPHTEAELDQLLVSGKVLFAVEIPANFERAVRRGEQPAMLVAGWHRSGSVGLRPRRAQPDSAVRTRPRSRPSRKRRAAVRDPHPRALQPCRLESLNIVPGLVGTILTMTMLIFTALSVTREIERGTMESLLAMPITPLEIMLGKIAPYVLVGSFRHR